MMSASNNCIFVEQEIDEEAFRAITPPMVNCLFEKLGPRRKFELKFNEIFRCENVQNVKSPHLAEETSESASSTLTNFTDESASSPSEPDSLLPTENKQSPTTVHYRHHAWLGQENLTIDPSVTIITSDLLGPVLATQEGSEIVAEYNKLKKLNRSKLCNLIIKQELRQDKNKRISSDTFKKYSQEIHDTFPAELPETYYSSYFKDLNGHVHSASGKLWDKYTNLRKFYKRIGLITSRSKPGSGNTSSDTSLIDESLNEIVQWLKNNSEPFADVLLKWKETYEVRLNTSNSIDSYINEYPALKLPLGYLLFESDFESVYDDKKNEFIVNWPILHNKIIKIAKNKNDKYISEFLESNIEGSEAENLALLILPLLLPTPPIKVKKTAVWKQSKIEQQNNFILQVESVNDLEAAIERKKNICAKYGTTKQPIPILVGSLQNIEGCYINVNNIFYKVDTLVKAVDTCFKIFHAVSAKYPTEAESTWLFIQKAIFKIQTNFDKHFIGVTSLISDLSSDAD